MASENDKVQLHLIGSAPKNEHTDSLLKEIELHPYREKIFFWGPKLNISSWLAYMNIGVLSSASEGLPVALLEYGLAGLVPIATRVGEINEVLENGRLGYVVAPENSELLAKTILIAIDSSESHLKATLFKKHVEQHYSESAIINQLLEIYRFGI